MDFENRPKSNISILEYRVIFEEKSTYKELQFDVKGTDGVPVVIELCFAKGGQLAGCELVPEKTEDFKIIATEASYTAGTDTIKFGPGGFAHQAIGNMEGEMYSTHFGSLRADGQHVYITGKTPFVHVLKIS